MTQAKKALVTVEDAAAATQFLLDLQVLEGKAGYFLRSPLPVDVVDMDGNVYLRVDLNGNSEHTLAADDA